MKNLFLIWGAPCAWCTVSTLRHEFMFKWWRQHYQPYMCVRQKCPAFWRASVQLQTWVPSNTCSVIGHERVTSCNHHRCIGWQSCGHCTSCHRSYFMLLQIPKSKRSVPKRIDGPNFAFEIWGSSEKCQSSHCGRVSQWPIFWQAQHVWDFWPLLNVVSQAPLCAIQFGWEVSYYMHWELHKMVSA